ncbi:MAG TPA: alpha/beta hydrolase [Pseudonocardiaceae bacterium]|jgi:pimeloyl-ACP methyl ester carboxylesterase|nr:alpha/beta hydrolase [Pseudonocardiaceae bacterium]
MADPSVLRFPSGDGQELAYREVGRGRPFVLLHGFMASGLMWLHHGLVTRLADQGYRVILPDFRGHGVSARPHDPAGYPPDVLAEDGIALIEHLGLDDYDLGGYSLGAKVVLRLLARGAHPARAIVAGQGLSSINGTSTRSGLYRRVLTALAEGTALEPGSPEERLAGWLADTGVDPVALSLVLDSIVGTTDAELREIKTPALVVVGEEDTSQANADELAATLPDARFARVPGDHGTALLSPELTEVITNFLVGQEKA